MTIKGTFAQFAGAVLITCFISSPSHGDKTFDDVFQQTIDSETHPANPPYGKIVPGFGYIPRNYNDSVESWKEALSVAQFLNAKVLQLQSGYWREDEPVKGAYQWMATERAFQAITEVGGNWQIAQDISGPFFHSELTTPEFLKSAKLTDPRFTAAYLQYLNSYLTKFGERLNRLLIHAEGSYNYFDTNPDHLPAYLNLLDRIGLHIKQNWPHIRLGVNIDINNSKELLGAIAKHIDFMGFDIVPVENFLDGPADLSKVIDHIMSSTGGKPVSMAAGWSSSEDWGGEEAQLLFYRTLFSVSQKYADRIEYITVGPPFEEQRDITGPAYHAQFTHLPVSFVEAIIDWATTLGLVRAEGSPKKTFLFLRSGEVE